MSAAAGKEMREGPTSGNHAAIGMPVDMSEPLAHPKPVKARRPRKAIKREKRPAKVRKTPRAKLIKIADGLARDLALRVGECEACGQVEYLQWAHGYSRKYLKTRWKWAYCLCRGCHYKYTLRWEAWLEWMRAKHGEGVLRELQMQALDTTPMTNQDIETVIEELRRQLEVA